MKIKNMSLILAEDCNLRCVYCYENQGRCENRYMSLDVAKKSIDFLLSEAVQSPEKESHLTFFGGEPLLNFAIMNEVFDYFNSQAKIVGVEPICHIITNGTLFPDGYEEFLKKYFTTGKKNRVQISIDGIPSIQDAQRIPVHSDKSSSQMVEEISKKYKKVLLECVGDKYEKNIGTHSVISPENVSYLFDSFMYVRSLGVGTYGLQTLKDVDWSDEQLAILETQLVKIADMIYEECLEVGNASPVSSFNMFTRIKDRMPEYPCLAGRGYVAVDTTGNFYPCQRFLFNYRDLTIGNIYDGLDKEKQAPFVDYSTENLIGETRCSECKNTGCTICIAHNKMMSDNILICDPMRCKPTTVENKISQDLNNRLISVGIIKTDSKCTSSSKDNLDPQIYKEVVETIRGILEPVLKTLDEKLDRIDEYQRVNNEMFKAVDGKVTDLLDIITISLLNQLGGNEK